ncbi:MAG: hypothetical protein K8S97_13510 [Anaerolineae bacterium]|nr:hypothetical protein [Anaerolineae bacterium]
MFFLVTGLVLYFILSRLRLVVLIHLSLGQALVVVGMVILVLFLGLDHLINRDRSPSRDTDEE